MIKKQEKQKIFKAVKKGRRRENDKDNKESNSQNQVEPPKKKPLTAYIIYFQDKKPLFVERYPSNLALIKL